MPGYIYMDYDGNLMDEDDIISYLNWKVSDMKKDNITDGQIYKELFENIFFQDRFIDIDFFLKLKEKYKYLINKAKTR